MGELRLSLSLRPVGHWQLTGDGGAEGLVSSHCGLFQGLEVSLPLCTPAHPRGGVFLLCFGLSFVPLLLHQAPLPGESCNRALCTPSSCLLVTPDSTPDWL